MNAAFLAPFVLHFGMVCLLYVALTAARAKAVLSGEAAYQDFRRAAGDPPYAARIRRNLANQFELPLFAYFAAAILTFAGAVGMVDIAAAWAFLIGRMIHSLVQTLTDNVRLRGYVFTINFLAVVVLMGHVAWLVLEAAR